MTRVSYVMKYVSLVALIIVVAIGTVVFVFFSEKAEAPAEINDATQGMPVPGMDGLEIIVTDTQQNGTPTSADGAPEGSIHNLPVPDAVSAVKRIVASVSAIAESQVVVLSAYEREWSDGCLGLGGPAESCIAVITPGYEVTVSVNGEESVYRTNMDGTSIRREK